MNLKEKLIKYRDMLKNSIIKKPSFSNNYMRAINNFVESTKLTEEQFEFIKKLYLQDGKIVGLHNTFSGDVDSFFDNGLYNYDNMNQKNTSLSNTVMSTVLFSPLISYHGKDTTIILSFDEDILKGKQGVFENLKNNIFGIPPEYIVGALKGNQIILNPNYNPSYKNETALKVDDPKVSFRSKEEKEEEVRICSTLFYTKKTIEDEKANKTY